MLDERERQHEFEFSVWSAMRLFEEQFARLTFLNTSIRQRTEACVEYSTSRSELHQTIWLLKGALEQALPEPRALPGQSWAEQIFAAVLIAYDERELEYLTGVPEVSGQELLQTQYAQLYDGGDKFYTFLERALRIRTTPALVLQLFLCCLRSGFCGRYADSADPERLSYLNELIERVSPHRPKNYEVTTPGSVNPIDGKNFPLWNYLAVFLVAFCAWTALKVDAYVHESKQVGITICEDP